MKNIIFFGDSITDSRRDRDVESKYCESTGNGYVFLASADIHEKYPLEYNTINKGISGNRIVDLYARIKSDVWNLNPDYLSILIGVNDIWHEIMSNNGVDLERFVDCYKTLLTETIKRFPNLKIMILEPYVLKGTATEERYEEFLAVKKYAKAIKEIAKEFNLVFVPLQDKFDELCEKYGSEYLLGDGVHPTYGGAKLIANEWLKGFEKLKG